jgi:hypothetical protein
MGVQFAVESVSSFVPDYVSHQIARQKQQFAIEADASSGGTTPPARALVLDSQI